MAVAVDVAGVSEREAERALRHADSAYAQTTHARAVRARRDAEEGRSILRRAHVRRQAARLLGAPRGWDAYFVADEARRHPALPELAAAVIGTDLNGTVRLWNAAAERLYGWPQREALGRAIGELTVGPQDAELAERIMDSVRRTGHWEGEFWVLRDDGTRFLAYVHDALVHGPNGQAVGVVGVSIDLDPGALVEIPDALGGLSDASPRERRAGLP
ncbi:PAS domain-containing protein [Solirubrobacter deserti]|uniref:PAS domain-containing protein n=1 Tax=Solirubrobacter deserti TaxID=2282478 RepID=A0ABT4RFF0_9ACTN|nr:PAS domain-containing protein [Solirubrobacter deserti]MDA0137273.1 PAS domain-containing protein [Solirubrobacter deserti]